MPNQLIGFTGFAQVGKDTAAQGLLKSGWMRVSFADPVRDLALAIDPIVEVAPATRLSDLVGRQGWDEAKKLPEVRMLLQRIGTEGVRRVIGDTTWVDLAMRKWENSMAPVVITDVRFVNEAEAIQKNGGFVVQITRPDVAPVNAHISDSGIPDSLIDAIIFNNGSIEDLHKEVSTTVLALVNSQIHSSIA